VILREHTCSLSGSRLSGAVQTLKFPEAANFDWRTGRTF